MKPGSRTRANSKGPPAAASRQKSKGPPVKPATHLKNKNAPAAKVIVEAPKAPAKREESSGPKKLTKSEMMKMRLKTAAA